MNLVLFLLVNVFICVFCVDLKDEQREIETIINPGCEEHYQSCDNLTFVHVKAEAKNDTLHYLWDFTGVPGIMLAKTSKKSNLTIQWNKLMNGEIGAVNFTETPSYVFAMVINKIYLFNDTKNTGLISDSVDIVTLDPHSFTWERINITEYPERVELIMNAKQMNGSFSLKVIRVICFNATFYYLICNIFSSLLSHPQIMGMNFLIYSTQPTLCKVT